MSFHHYYAIRGSVHAYTHRHTHASEKNFQSEKRITLITFRQRLSASACQQLTSIRHSNVMDCDSNPSQPITTHHKFSSRDDVRDAYRSDPSRSRFASRVSVDLGRGKGSARPTARTRQTRSYAICGSAAGLPRTSGRAEGESSRDRSACSRYSPRANRANAGTLTFLNLSYRSGSSIPLATGPPVRRSIARRARPN